MSKQQIMTLAWRVFFFAMILIFENFMVYMIGYEAGFNFGTDVTLKYNPTCKN